jgi:nucleotide-binding universal stress UspA family protein
MATLGERLMKPLAIRNILVATDFGTDTVAALKSVFELAALAGSAVHIVHAGIAPPGDDKLDADIANLESKLGRKLEVSVVAGPPAAAITQEANRTGADVIVLGHHRNRAGAPGSTADRVVRTARIPCLILPVPLTLPFATVLVPVDVGNVAGPLDVALTWASALRRRVSRDDAESTRVEVLHIHAGPASDQRELTTRVHDEVSAIRKRLADVAAVNIREHITHDNEIASTILTHADNVEAGLLVLGTRARRMESDPLGSVSSAVVRHATHPVLLVPPEVWQAAP